ncbi:MAG: porin family protein [Elusimicrobiaceae bacterium]|jgi:opacity protein-like surface antigen|nr:porin family protein [Elusimicrobiaceae bacterium]MBT4008246.1 porin family protein [Elusimicrobiaceae bacterium]MBT5987083.1 porin family protein [Elusimicrobiaceae bacterium]MBT6715010.1 porin family protein [Elusimicrobiaceae bacterium]
MKKIVLAVLLTLCFSNAFAGIDEGIDAGTKNLFVYGGSAYPYALELNGVETEYGSLGYAFGAQFVYNSKDWLGLGLDFNYSKADDNLTSTGDTTKSQMWTGMFMMKIYLYPEEGVRFYLPLYGGFGNAKISSSGTTNLNSTETGLAAGTGLGIDFDLNDMWILGVEFRFTRMFIDSFGANKLNNDFDYSNGLIKLGYKF